MSCQVLLVVVVTVNPQSGLTLVHAEKESSPCPPNLHNTNTTLVQTHYKYTVMHRYRIMHSYLHLTSNPSNLHNSNRTKIETIHIIVITPTVGGFKDHLQLHNNVPIYFFFISHTHSLSLSHLIRELEGGLVRLGVLLDVVEEVEFLSPEVGEQLEEGLDLARQVDGEEGAQGLLVLLVHKVEGHLVVKG